MLGAPTPILRSFDELKTKAFYVDFLSFEVAFEHRFASDMPFYLGLSKGRCRLRLSEHFGDASPGARVRIPSDDVRAFAKSLREKNYGKARPFDTELMAWGSWEITIHDPSDNRLTFYTEDKN